jgi:hypothetical protein
VTGVGSKRPTGAWSENEWTDVRCQRSSMANGVPAFVVTEAS